MQKFTAAAKKASQTILQISLCNYTKTTNGESLGKRVCVCERERERRENAREGKCRKDLARERGRESKSVCENEY